MMEAIPKVGDEWIIAPEILVAPLSLDQFWDAFWANDAPYFVQAMVRDEEDTIMTVTEWGPPTEGYEELHGSFVLQQR